MIIKIIGSGSAGNHIAYAFEQYAKKIYMFDLSKKELSRSKKIYISRYKKWNKNIIQSSNVSDQKFYDLVIISTPPSTHLNILKKNIQNSNNFLIEKPLSEPNDKTIKSFFQIIAFNKLFKCNKPNNLLSLSTIGISQILFLITKSIALLRSSLFFKTIVFLLLNLWQYSTAKLLNIF